MFTLYSTVGNNKSDTPERQLVNIPLSPSPSLSRLLSDETQRYPLMPPRQSTYRMLSSTSTVNNTNKEDTKEPNDHASLKVPKTKGDSPRDDVPLTVVTKPTFRTMVQQYGPLFVCTYLTVYVSTVFGFYLGIESGWLDPAYLLSIISGDGDSDSAANSATVVANVLNRYSLTQWAVPYVEESPWAANLAVAWIVTKPTEPIRFGVTVGILPLLARTLGYVSAVPKSTTAMKKE
jgi:hypothetical protein